MASNHDRAAVEDLEAMLERSLKIQASPPHWQPNYKASASSPSLIPGDSGVSQVHHQRNEYIPQSYGHQQGQQQSYVPSMTPSAYSSASPPGAQLCSRTYGRQITPQHYQQPSQSQYGYSGGSPKAIYSPQRSVETQAIPTASAYTGIRGSPVIQSFTGSDVSIYEHSYSRYADSVAEAQRQQQIVQQQQAEHQRLEAQGRARRLAALQKEQLEQERELEMLKRSEYDARQRQSDALLREQEAYAREVERRQNAADLRQRERQLRDQEEYAWRLQKEELAEREHQLQLEREAEEDAAEARDAALLRETQLREAEQREAEEREREAEAAELAEAMAAHDNAEAIESGSDEDLPVRTTALNQDPSGATPYRGGMEAAVLPTADSIEGAATMLQRTQDQHGNVTTRVVKKGVHDFDFKEELGTGSYSTVVAAQDKQTLRQYAIKVLDKAHIIKEQKVKYVDIEKLTLNRLGDHPGIIRLYFTFQDRQSLYFVLDFAPNGELLHLIKRIGSLNEDCARYFSCQLLDAIDYMHQKGVIHRDLKPENILLDYKMRIKITDFGTAKLLMPNPETNTYPSDTRASSFVGTAEYVSPELLVGKSQGKSADLWAWGCVLYQMIAAVPPFQANTQYLTFQKIAKVHYAMPPGFPYVVRDLLSHVLVKAPSRWTISEIKQHEFFEGVDWSAKALWGSSPPRLQPYKVSVASMKPRQLAGSSRGSTKPGRPIYSSRPMAAAAASASQQQNQTQSQSRSQKTAAAAVAPQQKTVFVPTSAGLQALNPSTLYGMPVHLGKDESLSQQIPAHVQAQKTLDARKQVLSLATRLKRPGASSSPSITKPAPTSAYQQSQERIQALTRRVAEQRQGRANAASNGSASTSPRLAPSSSLPRLNANLTGSSNSGIPTRSATTPKSPDLSDSATFESAAGGPLSQPPLSQLEQQFSNVLVSAQERLLRVGNMSVFVSNHPPPPATSQKVRKGEDAGAETTSSGAVTASGVPAYSYGDDSLLSKLLTSKARTRMVIITTWGRLLVMSEERKILYEVPLGLPQIDIRELPFQTSSGNLTSKILIQTYNKVLTLGSAGQIEDWMNTIELSKRYYAQLVADLERNTHNAAAAAASAVASRRR